MTTTHITHSRAEAPEMAEAVCPSVRQVETPMISELVLAMLRLEHLAETAAPPEDETAAQLNGLTPERHRSFVLGNADRIRTALDKISAPFEAAMPSPPSFHSHHRAGDAGSGHRPPTSGCDATTGVWSSRETAALAAVLTGDRGAAQRLVADLYPSERAVFAGQLDELRNLLGPVCDNCGTLAEIGTATTDPFSESCRFLCSRCTAAHRTS